MTKSLLTFLYNYIIIKLIFLYGGIIMNFTKKLFLTTALLAAVSVPASAATIEFTIGDTDFLTESQDVYKNHILEAAPFINESGRTMVPIRAISEAFGADVAWDDTTRMVTITNADKEIKLTIDNTLAYINGNESALDCTPVIVNGRTFVPVRFISEAFSYNVNYATTTKQVVIDDSPIVLTCGDKSVSLAEFKELYNLFYYSVHDEAIASGTTEEEIVNYATNAAFDNAVMIARTQNTFPSIPFTADDYTEIAIGIEENSKLYQSKLPALNTVVTEKYYFSLGKTIISSFAETIDSESIYKTDYVCAKHILVEDEALANEIYTSLNNGGDFDIAVTEYGIDPGMTQNPDGYVFTKGEMVPEFETTAFALKDGEMSKPVKTSYGYHIIKREPLPEMTEEIKLTMATTKANEFLSASEEPTFLMSNEEIIALLK